MENRNKKYFTNKKTAADKKLEELVVHSADNKIDQDFKGFPRGHASEKIIKPETETEKRTADVDNKDGEKINYEAGEIASDGSAGAFAATESVKE